MQSPPVLSDVVPFANLPPNSPNHLITRRVVLEWSYGCDLRYQEIGTRKNKPHLTICLKRPITARLKRPTLTHTPKTTTTDKNMFADVPNSI